MKDVVNTNWLFDHLNDPDLIILDATLPNQRLKQPEFIQTLQIKSARYFDLKQKFSDTSNEFPTAFPKTDQFEKEAQNLGICNDSKIIVYDANGMYSSARVWWLFKAMGHEQVAVLNGGLPAWIRENYPFEHITPAQHYKKGNFKAIPNFKSVRKFEAIQDNTTSGAALVVDVRSCDRFTGKVAEPRAGLRSGTIPNSINIPYTEVLHDNGTLKSSADLERIFAPVISEERPLIFSCGSGITACIAYLAAQQVLVNDLAVYDGSWTEWGSLVKS